jgi:glucokinase
VVRLTNAAWTFSRDEIKSRLGLHRLLLLNDFTALALSLPRLAPLPTCVRSAAAQPSRWQPRRYSVPEPASASPACSSIAATGWR